MRDEAPVFDEALIEAEEDFVIDAQFLIQELLNQQGMSRAELARRIGVSKARLTQMLRPDANPTLRTVARVFQALGHKAQLTKRMPLCQEEGVKLSGELSMPAMAAWFEGVRERVSSFRSEQGLDSVRAFRSMYDEHGRFIENQRSKQFDVVEVANDHIYDRALQVAV